MKNNLLFLLFLVFTLNSFSQDPVLFDHTWYLEKVVIVDEEFFAVSNEEVEQVTLNMSVPSNDNFISLVCNELFGFVNYQGIDSFTFEALNQTLAECNLTENALFELTYFSFFFSTMEEVFTYDISENKGDYFLVITNDDGDQAFYGNQPTMSIPSFSEWNFSLFPNPAQNILNIHLNKIQNVSANIYSINGKLMHKQPLDLFENKIDIKSLNAGVYFLEIEDENGNKQIKKFIKK